MNAVCMCCGTYGPIESHHVGGRRYSGIEVNVCVPDHRILSEWVAERRWSTDAPVTARIILGAIDVGRLMAMRNDPSGLTAALLAGPVRRVERLGLLKVRPGSTVTTVDVVGSKFSVNRDHFVAATKFGEMFGRARVASSDALELMTRLDDEE